jgi:cytochrome c-type biogenesis protein CcmE
MRGTTKILITVAVILGGVGYAVYTTVSSGEALEYFKHVDEVMQRPELWRDKRVKLHGNVVAGTILKGERSLDFLFALHRGGRFVDVSYHGIVPDSFKDCAEVVVTGKLEGNIFRGEEISAKCPSKYDGVRQTGCGEEHRAAVLAVRSGHASR